MSLSILYARLKGAEFDIENLRRYFLEKVATTPAVPYRDNDVEYEGWAVTSRDGSVDDYIRRPSRETKKPNSSRGRVPAERATVPTVLCAGAAKTALDTLTDLGLAHFRARFLRLRSVSYNMGFHKDLISRRDVQETWRLHIPVFSGPESQFQWRTDDGEVVQAYLPADGSAYLVRVDLEHRAVYNVLEPTEMGRVHIVMGIAEAPRTDRIEPLMLAAGREAKAGPAGFSFDHAIWLGGSREAGTCPAGAENLGPGAAPVVYRKARSAAGKEAARRRQEAYVVIDGETGDTLRSHKETAPIDPAGLVKLLVLYEVFDLVHCGKLSLGSELAINRTRAGRSGQAPKSDLFGDRNFISTELAIRTLVQRQANAAARAIAQHIYGDDRNCATQLTHRACTLGLPRTRLLNITGAHHPKQASTALEMARLCRSLIRDFPMFLHYFAEAGLSIDGTFMPNRNPLLLSFEGVDGLLSARNRFAGHHIAVTAERNGRRLIALVTGADSEAAAADKAAALLDEILEEPATVPHGSAMAK